jgi:hypothetical protein
MIMPGKHSGPVHRSTRGKAAILLVACLLVHAPSRASEPPAAAELITPEAERAIERGLTLLASQQNHDGSFGSGRYRGNAAVSALAGIAFLAGGSTPRRGPYGRTVDRCVDYLLDHVEQSGLIVDPASGIRGPMYGHGFATLFLAQCYGMSRRPELREKLTRAVNLIVQTQNDEGGWRYFPRRDDADLSVTVCQVMALRAARDAGLRVPKETIDLAVAYVKRCQNDDGGFMYTLQGREPSQFARSAAGVVTLQSAGIYRGPELERAVRYLEQFTPGKVQQRPGFYYYGHYYAVQAMWHTGGDHWQRWYPAIRDELVGEQQDSRWLSDYGPEYATAMACIILQLPNDCLPIFQK